MDKKKKILAALVAATMLTSAVPAVTMAAAVSIEESGNAVLQDDTTYVSDDFNSYTSDYNLAQVATEQTKDITDAKLTVSLGARDCKTDPQSKVEFVADDENTYLNLISGKYATSQRGGTITFNSSAAIPAYASIADDNVLNLSFKAKFKDSAATLQVFGLTSDETSKGGQVVNDPYLSIANNSEIPTDEWVNVNFYVDNAKNATLIVTDADGKLLSTKSFTASGTALVKIGAYGAASEVAIDNLLVKETANPLKSLTLNVKDADAAAVNGAVVTVDKMARTLSADSLAISVPTGTYSVTVAKEGYTGETKNVEVTDATQADLTLTQKNYTPVPTTITISGGQLAMTAPIENASVTSAAFTALAKDQESVKMDNSTLSYVWEIVDADGSADENVTIADGVITVKKGFTAGENHVKEFTVKATATNNSESSATGETKVKISDYLFYEPGVDSASYGGTIHELSDGSNALIIPTTSAAATMKLPEAVKFEKGKAYKLTFDHYYQEKGLYTFERNLTLQDSAGNSVIAPLTFCNSANASGLNIGTGATSGSDGADWSNGKVWATYNANTWIPVSITFITYSDGTTKAIAQANGGEEVTYTLDSGVTDLASFLFKAANTNDGRYVAFKNFVIQEIDANATTISGAENIATIDGQTVKSDYEVSSTIMEDGETFTWEVEGETSQDGKAQFTGLTAEKATAITVDYDENNFIKSIKLDKDITVKDGTVTVEGTVGQKVMLWEDLTGIKPLSPVKAITTEASSNASPVPTVTPGEDTTKATVSVADNVPDGEYVLKATSATDASKTASFTINVAKATVTSFDFTGDENIQFGAADTTTYAVSNIKDQFGNDVSEYFTPSYTSSNTAVATIDAAGVLTPVAAGTTKVSVTVGTKTEEKTVTVADYYVSSTATGDSTDVDISGLIKNDNVTGYLVTTADADKKLVKQTTVELASVADNKITADTTGATTVEVAPIYTYNNVGSVADGYKLDIPSDTYDFTFKKSNGKRTDLLVNGYLVGQNVDQGGNNRGTEGSLYSVDNIIVKDGSATISATDFDKSDSAKDGAKLDSIVVTKTPSNVARKTHVYIAGDSTVCIYYGNDDADVKDLQTGWGQVIDTYLTDDVTILDLANSGIYTKTWMDTTFATVSDMAQKGDYLLIQFGINDRTYSSLEIMQACLESMIDTCREKGIIPVLITPQKSVGYAWYTETDGAVSWSDYGSYGTLMKTVAESKKTLFIDSGAMSADAFYKLGADYVTDNFQLSNEEKKMHFSYAGAQKLASMIAQSIYDQQQANTVTETEGENFNGLVIDLTGKFTFTDTNETEQTYQVTSTAE